MLADDQEPRPLRARPHPLRTQALPLRGRGRALEEIGQVIAADDGLVPHVEGPGAHLIETLLQRRDAPRARHHEGARMYLVLAEPVSVPDLVEVALARRAPAER